MSSYGGSGGTGGGSVVVVPSGEAPKRSHPFIDWSSPGSLLSAFPRAVKGATEAAGEAVIGAGKGLPALLYAPVDEAYHNVRSRADDIITGLAHGDFEKAYLALESPYSSEQVRAVQDVFRAPSFDEGMEKFTKSQPLTGALLGSAARAGQDVEQVVRAGGNTLLPGQPLGSGVGQLGSGPGLLGKTALAQSAKAGGPGVLPKLLEDAANAAIITGPVSSLIGGAATRAAAEAGEAGAAFKAAEAAAKTATKDANAVAEAAAKNAQQAQSTAYQASAAASTGDPTAAVNFSRLQQEAQTARQAAAVARRQADQVAAEHAAQVQTAQSAVDLAEQHASTLKEHAATAKLVHNLGVKAANSPFAAMGFAGRGVLDTVLGPSAEALVGSKLGQRFLQPVLDKAAEHAATLAQTRATRGLVQEGLLKTADETATLRRGMKEAAAPLHTTEAPGRSLLHPFGGGKQVMVEDLDAQAVATMQITAEGLHIKNLAARGLNPAVIEDVINRSTPRTAEGGPQYTPEQIALATEVFGPAPDAAISERAAELRKAIPKTVESYTEGPAAQVTEGYSQLRGETEPLMQGRTPVTEGAWAQVEHNIEGREPNIEQLDQWRKAVKQHAKLRARFEKGHQMAGRALTRAAAKLEGIGLSPEELKDPKLLLARVAGPATKVARDVVAANEIPRLLEEGVEPRLANIAKRAGKVPAEITARDLASEILKLSVKDPTTLSPVAADLVQRAAAEGIGQVPKGLPDIARSAKPAELLGAGRERLRQGTAEYERAVRMIAKGQEAQGEARALLAEPAKPPSERQLSAARRVVTAIAHLRELGDKVAEARGRLDEGLTPEGHVATPIAAARKLVRETRQALKEWNLEEAKTIEDEWRRMDIREVNPNPPIRSESYYVENKGGNRDAGQRRVKQAPDWSDPAWNAGGGDVLQNLAKEDPQLYRWATRKGFFDSEGKTPEEIVTAYHRARGQGGQAGASGVEWDMGDWLEDLRKIKAHEDAAKSGITTEKYTGNTDEIAGWLENVGGYSREAARAMAEHIGEGHPNAAADAILATLDAETRHAGIASAGDVQSAAQRAIEADQQADIEGRPRTARAQLDEAGRAAYDAQVAEMQQGVQARIVQQREGQAERVWSPARAQGQREGGLLGRANEQIAEGERAATRGDRNAVMGANVVGAAPELTVENAQRMAGPIGQLYAKAGAAERDVIAAAREYNMQQRALDRLDQGLAETHDKLMASVAAAPRPDRPFMELGRRINRNLLPMADDYDEAFGAGAGDVLREAAADAVVSVKFMRDNGIDPTYLPGMEEGPRARNPDLKVLRQGETLPGAGATGQRKAGVGLRHATAFEHISDQMARRIARIIKNETVQKIADTLGGKLSDQLAQRMGISVDDLATMSQADLVKNMHDAGLSAWNVFDDYGKAVPDSQVTLDTQVIPKQVFRKYSSYYRENFASRSKLLRMFDLVQQKWKVGVLVLTGRWHMNEILGNTMMGMVGTGTLPPNYFHNVRIASRLEKMRLGLADDADRAFVERYASPALREALEQTGGHTPGSVVDSGYFREEFGPHPKRPGLHPIDAGWRLQSHLDDVNRTAVWISHLDKGLDAAGLADFRKAYPSMADLTDAQIRNEAAIRLSIRTIGDYKNFGTAEQEVLKRVFPFYPWLRHITKLSLNLAIHNPVRVAWLLHLGQMFSPGTSQVDWLQNNYDIGGNRWLSPPNWNPFDSVSRIFDPNNPFGAVSPILATGAAALGGYDIKGHREITRAPGTGNASGMTPLLGRPGELAYYLSGQLPQGRAFRESIPALLGGKPIARYQTGQPVLVGGQTISTQDQQIPFTNRVLPAPVGPLVPLLGLGYQRKLDEQEILAAQLKREERARKQRAAYERRRAAAG